MAEQGWYPDPRVDRRCAGGTGRRGPGTPTTRPATPLTGPVIAAWCVAGLVALGFLVLAYTAIAPAAN